MRQRERIEILLVEDNPGDIDLTREAFAESGPETRLHVAQDGEEALDFVFKQGRYAEAVTPDLILLDLNLRKRDGREVLAKIKEDALLRRIPVIVLTTSVAEDDIQNAYDLHANCYIQKPVDFNQFVHVIRKIEDFWFALVHLPIL